MHRLILKAKKKKKMNKHSSSDESLSSDDENEVSEGIVGKIFNNSYLCVKYLGRGTFSRVWLVVDLKSNTFYAMKMQLPEYKEDTQHEISILNKLNNNNNVNSKVGKLYDTFVVNISGEKHYCLIMELLGSSLLTIYDIFKDEQIPLNIIKRILKDILLGLGEIHAKKIIHTDLKMENILLEKYNSDVIDIIEWFNTLEYENFIKKYQENNTPENIFDINKMKRNQIKRKIREKSYKVFSTYFLEQIEIYYNNLEIEEEEYTLEDMENINVKIVDFGNAEIVNNLEQDLVSLRSYRSPENIIGTVYDTKTDIWTLGCIAYELFTNKPLFDISKLRKTIDRDRDHLCQMYKILGKMPKHLTINCEFSDDLFDSKGRILKNRDIEKVELSEILKKINYNDDDCFLIESLIKTFLEYNYLIRKSSVECLEHLFFKNTTKIN